MARFRVFLPLVGFALALGTGPLAVPAQDSARPAVAAANASPALLTREEAGTRMPATVFFRGQTAPVQARNATGIRFPGGRYLLAAAVDTSGYASSVAQTYQGYLLTEVVVRSGGHELAPGAYGFGFVGNSFVCMNLAGREILRAPALQDSGMKRPVPLQMVPEPGGSGAFRLYSGRSYFTFTAAAAAEQ